MGQDYSYRLYNYAWKEKVPKTVSFDTAFAKFPAVILNESIELIFDPFESKSFYFNTRYFPGQVYFRKTATVQLLDKAGVQSFSTITLPESFDPEFDRMFRPFEKNNEKITPILFDVEVKYFAARVLGKNGQTRSLKPKDKAKLREIFIRDEFYKSYSFEYKLEGLQEGDVLEYAYEYSIPFIVYYFTSSCRYFFHSEFPKQFSKFSLTRQPSLFFYRFNGAKSDTYYNSAKGQTVNFLDTALAATGVQPGSCMNKDLPFIGFFYYNSFMQEQGMPAPLTQDSGKGPYFTPPMIFMSANKRTSALYQSQFFTSSKVKLDKYYHEITSGIADTLPHKKLLAIHQDICNNFKYVTKWQKFINYDVFNDLGDVAEKKTLYEDKQEDLYEELMGRTGFDKYLYAGYADKRIETFHPEIFFPLLSWTRAYAIPVGKNVVSILPKKSRTGFKTNEFPFYYEDVKVYYYSNLPDSLSGKSRLTFKVRQTPYSDENANIRTYNAVMRASFDTLLLRCEGRLSLAGQFSTMTRGLYLYDDIDSTLNSNYKKKIWNFRKGVKLIKQEATAKGEEYPFKHNFKFRYQCPDMLSKVNDTVFEADLSGLFNHIIHPDFSAKLRTLTYYPDFIFQDKIHYQLIFDREFRMKDSAIVTIHIPVSKGYYSVRISQPTDTTLDIESFLVIADIAFPVSNANEIESFTKAAMNLNSSRIRLVVKPKN